MRRMFTGKSFRSDGSDGMRCRRPILLDFSDKENISCEKIAFSFEDMGCRLVIVNTGKGHADLSEEYSSIPMEMREAAKAMGVELLCESIWRIFLLMLKISRMTVRFFVRCIL